MVDVPDETKASAKDKNDETGQQLLSDAYKDKQPVGNALTATATSDLTAGKGTQGLLPVDLSKNLKDLQSSLETTQKQIAELRKNSGSELYDLELSRRSMLGNPYKALALGTSIAMPVKGLASLSPWLSPGGVVDTVAANKVARGNWQATAVLTGFAALQGYDDYKNLRDQTTFGGYSKYAAGLLADTAVGAGSIAFLSESVPMKYKAPLVVGGLLARAAIDFIPDRKK